MYSGGGGSGGFSGNCGTSSGGVGVSSGSGGGVSSGSIGGGDKLLFAAMFGAVRQNTPRVSYVSALDIWMCTCIIFVFFTLLEYVVVLW